MRLRRSGMVDMEPNVTLVQQYPAHEAIPEGPSPFPAVVIVHDVYGLTPEICGAANRLAREGFCAVAPNFYARPFSAAAGAPPEMRYPMAAAAEAAWDGYPVRCWFRHDEGDEARALAAGLSRARAHDVFGQALGWADRTSDAARGPVAAVGYGIGGRLAFRAACDFPDRVGALVALSPSALAAPFALRPDETMPILEYESLRAACLLFFGERDGGAPAEERAAIETALASSGRRDAVVVLAGAEGGFFDTESPEFRIGAARQAWEGMVAFLRRALGGPPPESRIA